MLFSVSRWDSTQELRTTKLSFCVEHFLASMWYFASKQKRLTTYISLGFISSYRKKTKTNFHFTCVSKFPFQKETDIMPTGLRIMSTVLKEMSSVRYFTLWCTPLVFLRINFEFCWKEPETLVMPFSFIYIMSFCPTCFCWANSNVLPWQKRLNYNTTLNGPGVWTW